MKENLLKQFLRENKILLILLGIIALIIGFSFTGL
jgi:predicted negative regulator of RcsB-dependent stress response